MSGFMNSWGQLPGSPPPFFPFGDTGGFGLSGMENWGSMSSPPVMSSTMPTSVPGAATGVTGAIGIGGLTPKMGFNMPTAQLALSGLSTIGNLWAAFQAQKLAKEQFKYTKGVTETNLANSIKTYNTGLTDRANNRAIAEGRTPTQTQAYIDANSLSRYGRG